MGTHSTRTGEFTLRHVYLHGNLYFILWSLRLVSEQRVMVFETFWYVCQVRTTPSVWLIRL